MNRRSFITLLGGVASAWPITAEAQQTVRRVAVVMGTPESDVEGQGRLRALLDGLRQRGWFEGQNLHIDVRWTGGNFERTREIAAQVVAQAPDLIIANSTTVMAAMKQATSSIPVIFVLVNEPVAQGFIVSMARPGGNVTGFTMIDFSMVGKSVEMLHTMAPAVTRVGLMFNPETYPYYDIYLRSFQAEAHFPVEVVRAAVRSPDDIEAVIADLAARPGSGVAVPPDPFTVSRRALIRQALDRHRLPHIFAFRQFVREGGLMSYGPDTVDIFRRSAAYAAGILKGANPGELPAQAPDKFELAVNIKTARMLGLDVPTTLLAVADEVIE